MIVVAGLLMGCPGAACASSAGTFTVPFEDGAVRFDYWIPDLRADATPEVLLLIPGYNGDGAKMLSSGWLEFAEGLGVVLLAPSFRTSPQKLARREGYYYPEQGSGKAVELALAELRRKVPLRTERIYLFGFSAGAHFAHRFAAWKPDGVAAFVAGGAAWWDEPTAALKKVPAFIFCGEADPRLAECERYFAAGEDLDLPWVWRAYRGMRHSVSPAMLRTARAFLAHYLRSEADAVGLYGDIQTYEVSRNADDLPEATRLRLPSMAFAEIWRRED